MLRHGRTYLEAIDLRLYLIRHGETEYNAVGRMQGWQEIPLNDAGIAQASLLGQRLTGTRIDHIYSSDIRRTVMTACIVAAHTGTSISYEPLYRERNPGDLTDLEYEHCEAFFTELDFEPPNGESPAVFNVRVREAFAKLIELEGDSDRHIGVVTHGMVCNDFVKICLGYDPREDPDFHWPNTCLTICDYADGKWTVDTLACAAHLDEQPTGHATGG